MDANANDADSDERVNAFDVATPAAAAAAGIVASTAVMASKNGNIYPQLLTFNLLARSSGRSGAQRNAG
ncbi:hypothetical protein AWZ03_011017 [Drosophila navojoa]|uniref:Uncharacterized protein n=1 Tax=Drosophila navojoa TaxID=7232 RepID=A0A484B1G1_DRONA|nr:hypothetical protein AWZ03_011017 [Drosophila navojoa]